MSAPGFSFEDDGHVYRNARGNIVPNVTLIMESVGISGYEDIPKRVLDWKSELGTAAHLACKYADEDGVDWESLDQRYRGYVCGWEKFKEESGFQPHPDWIERRGIFTIDGMECGMTIDRVGLWDKQEYTTEIKCTADEMPSFGIQTAAYAMGYFQATKKITKRCAVQLFPDGGYKVHYYNDNRDLQVFRAALQIAYWKLAKGKSL